jgi:predicted nucleic acid-binding protein
MKNKNVNLKLSLDQVQFLHRLFNEIVVDDDVVGHIVDNIKVSPMIVHDYMRMIKIETSKYI